MRARHLFGLGVALAGLAGPVGAFTIIPPYEVGAITADEIARLAPRWELTGAQRIQVAVAPGFAAAVGAGHEFPDADYEQAVQAAFAAWQTPELQFEIRFDGGGPADILLDATDGSHPEFAGNLFTGLCFLGADLASSRTLTNGELGRGWVISGAEILIAVDRFHDFFELLSGAGAFGLERRIDRFRNLMMHEVGHAIGLGHANDVASSNLDNDLDPLSSPYVDPVHPFAGIQLSPNRDRDAVMSSSHASGAALVRTTLANDDRLGRNVLYPSLPEPPLALMAAAAAVLACRRRT